MCVGKKSRIGERNCNVMYRWLVILLFIQFILAWFIIFSQQRQNSLVVPVKIPVSTGCQIPRLTPGDATLRALDLSQGLVVPHCIGSKGRSNLKFKIDRKGSLIRLHVKDDFWNLNTCVYQATDRIPDKSDFNYIYHKQVPINNVTVLIPSPIQSIKITCTSRNPQTDIVYEDYLSTVNPISAVVERPLPRNCRTGSCNAYSVLIFGQDSSSHMNFIRHMPAAHEYLMKAMGAIEFHGFNSLGAGTLWSVLALLTGIRLDELRPICWSHDYEAFDSCPFIWNKFKDAGYVTSYNEDGIRGGIFNAGVYGGFKKSQPVDYDFRGVMNLLSNPLRGHAITDSLCYGSRLAFDIVLDNLLKFATAFSSRPYFHFSWTSSLTHDSNPASKFGEEYLLRALQTLHTENLLHNTIFIMISDHGMRYGPLRMKTRQGFLEERLPILYLILPEKFRKAYPIATKNVESNALKLVTAYDIYAMLEDILEPGNINSGAMLDRTAINSTSTTPRGISLFREISPDRNCETIGFHDIYCSCLKRLPINVNSSIVVEAAIAVVSRINDMLVEHSQCANLSVDSIQSAFSLNAEFDVMDESARFRRHANEPYLTAKDGTDLEIQFSTLPDNAIYYAYVALQLGKTSVQEINRISAYGNSSSCVSENSLKPYCYCVNNSVKL